MTGDLPPEVIDRIVRQSFGRFRLCYENGLRTDPKLSGNVTVGFVIDGTGAVTTSASTAATTLPDPAVVACVVRAFASIAFAQPNDGHDVTVVYPIIFAPAG